MCGIAGFWAAAGRGVDDLKAVATRMALAIQHRGPDDAGAWADAQAGIALGHRRLSIVDLSPAGHQPMAIGRWALRHRLQRRDLQPPGIACRIGVDRGSAGLARAFGYRDLLAAFEHWGVEATLQKTVGMFAIALWDVRERTLAPGARPLWRKAAVLRLGEWCVRLWFGTEGVARLPWLCQPGEPRGAGVVHAFYLCAGAAQHLSGDLQARTGLSAQCLRSTPKNGRFSAAAPAGDRAGHHAAALVVFGGGGGGRGEKSDCG